ncbi:MAG: head GIN domain-containing protein [Bacteroidota bacterium]
MKSTPLKGLIAALVFLSFSQTACELPQALPCVNGEGSRVTETREPVAFDKIIIDSPADVYLHLDSSFTVDITAQDNILAEITTEVTGGILEINNDRCLRSYKTIRIDVYVPSLSMIEVKGSGDVYTEDRFTATDMELKVNGSGGIEMNADLTNAFVDIAGSGDVSFDGSVTTFDASLLGSGNLKMAGTANEVLLGIDGSGDVKGFDLDAQTCNIDIAGSGNCEVSVINDLNVKIRGTGNVYYKGNPSVNVTVTGSGEIIDAN